jgi:hypothetical protein
MRWCLLIFIALSTCHPFFAQRNVKDSAIGITLIGVHYGGNWTGGDLAKRYGFMNNVGLNAGYKTKKNFYCGLDASYLFGNNVRMTGIFDHLIDSFGNITDINGDIALVQVFARGFHANLSFGMVIPVLSPNKNSGIMVHAGAGYLLHFMRIETQEQVVPAIELDYKRGYDRMTTGFNLHQFIGYTFMANRGFYNFNAGFYMQEGFTKNRRDIFFDQPDVPVSKKTMIDLQYGFRVTWYIPVYKRKPKDFYYD